MPLVDHITHPLLPDHHYHIYNRGNMENNIFFSEGNYDYFLRKYNQYMYEYMDTYAYALIPNHFHLAVRIKSREEVLTAAVGDLKRLRKDAWERLLRKVTTPPTLDLTVFEKLSNLPSHEKLFNLPPPTPLLEQLIPLLPPLLLTELASWALSERLRRFMLGYSKAINKQNNRYGSLLQKPFRRKIVNNEQGFQRLIAYIHRNGVHHGYSNSIEHYPYSSYPGIVSSSSNFLAIKETMELFGGMKNFLQFHGTMPVHGFMDEPFVIEG